MDLSLLTMVDEPVSMALKHPIDGTTLVNGIGKPMTLLMLGLSSQEVKELERGFYNKRSKKQAQGSAKNALTLEELEAEGLKRILACVKGWENIEFESKELEFSRENVKMLLEKCEWIEKQVLEFIGEEANFIKAS